MEGAKVPCGAISWNREENWAFEIESPGTNDGPIGIGLGRDPVLNLVRLSRGGLSNVAAKKFQASPIGKVKTYVHLFPETGMEFQASSPVVRDSA